MAEGKTHLSLVICGHVDSGKSTTTGHLLFQLGGINERELEKLKAEAERRTSLPSPSRSTWTVRRRSASVV